MTSKVQFYSAMASYTATHLTDSWQRWTAFLTTASRLYKYPFHEQLMIFAQRPDATACAEYDLWNDTMRRYVRRGSKGIALWTIPAKSPGFGMCSTFPIPACGKIPATPFCGSFARSMRRRWPRRLPSGLERRPKTTWRNSLKASRPSLSVSIGWNTSGTYIYDQPSLCTGAAPKDVQEPVGHSDVSTTMNIYAHATREAKRTSARLLDKVVGTA